MRDDDAELLRRYAADRAEDAFAELVRRHVDFVYSAALRQANGDAHLAQDATQQVFTDLARKAAPLAERAVLTGWLFTSTRFAVAKLVRSEQRRRAREQTAHLMNEIQDDPAEWREWDRVRPVLDAALAGLKAVDREAVLLRFFGGRDFAAIGARLQLSENAARMRVDRALDQLHAQLARRGVTSSISALGAVLANQAVASAPAGLATTITGTALAGAAGGGMMSAALAFMSMNKLALGIVGALLVTGTTGFVVQGRTTTALRAELQQARAENRQIATLQAENLRERKTGAEIEAMRADDNGLVELNNETETLQNRMRVALQRSARPRSARAPVDLAKLDLAPQPRSQVAPKFPVDLRTADGQPLALLQGTVVVDFIVDSTGAVRDARAAQPSVPEIDAAVVEAVNHWTFAPGQKGGRPVTTHMQVPIVFGQPAADSVPQVSTGSEKTP